MRIYLCKNCFKKHKLRPVPWDWGSALLIVFLFLFLPGLLLTWVNQIPISKRPSFLVFAEPAKVVEFELKTEQKTSSENKRESSHKKTDEVSALSADQETEPRKLGSEHPLTELLIRSRQTNQYFFIVCLCFLTAVIIAPITEEFVFRVVFQRSLEPLMPIQSESIDFPQKNSFEEVKDRSSLEVSDNITNHSSRFQRIMFRCLIIGIPAILFSLIHYRSPNEVRDLNLLLLGIFISPIGNFLVVVLGVLWLKILSGVNLNDFGISFRTMPQDFLNGVIAFFMILPILALVRIQMFIFFPNIVTDPIPIFVFAIALGLLFERTGRFVSIVAMHATLNFCSFLMILLV